MKVGSFLQELGVSISLVTRPRRLLFLRLGGVLALVKPKFDLHRATRYIYIDDP